MAAIGIFGGSFNPIHNGHVSLARQLCAMAGLDEVWLMVSPQNPLKQDHDLLADELRMQMVRLALRRETRVKPSDYELHLPKPSYTWNTLQSLSRDFPDDRFTLLIGGDNWQLFPRWHRASDIMQNYDICVYPRRGSEIDASSLPARVRLVEAELLDISSTDIRRRLADGQPIAGLVPSSVARFITKNHLYQK